jgi:hypothetical protein
MKLGRLYHIGVARPSHFRHPELVSGSISRRERKVREAEWMLKRVQHDGVAGEWA